MKKITSHITRNITYRPITSEDRDYLLELYSSSREDIWDPSVPMLRQDKEQFIEMQFNLQDAHYRKHYADADFSMIVLKDQNIGRLYLLEMQREYRVIDITIHPSYRSRGYGSQILNSIIDKSINRQKDVTIHVEKNNKAISLYQRFGFCIEKSTDVYDFLKRQYTSSNTNISKTSLIETATIFNL